MRAAAALVTVLALGMGSPAGASGQIPLSTLSSWHDEIVATYGPSENGQEGQCSTEVMGAISAGFTEVTRLYTSDSSYEWRWVSYRFHDNRTGHTAAGYDRNGNYVRARYTHLSEYTTDSEFHWTVAHEFMHHGLRVVWADYEAAEVEDEHPDPVWEELNTCMLGVA